MPMPSASSRPPTGRIHSGPPVFDRLPSSADPLPPVPSPEPFGAAVVDVVGAEVVVVDAPPPPPDDVVAVVDDPDPLEVVSVVATSVPDVDVDDAPDVDVDVEDALDDVEVDEVAAAVSFESSPRLPGFATARSAPITNTSAAAAPTMVNLGFRTHSPRSLESG